MSVGVLLGSVWLDMDGLASLEIGNQINQGNPGIVVQKVTYGHESLMPNGGRLGSTKPSCCSKGNLKAT